MLPAFDLLDLQPTEDPHRFRLVARRTLCTPFGFLYGGSGIAASIEAAERATGRPLQWITTQFIGTPVPDDVVDLTVTMPAHGRATTQAQVVGTVGDRAVFTSLCAHTERPSGDATSFLQMPEVRSPEECRPMAEPFAAERRRDVLRSPRTAVGCRSDRHRRDRRPAGRPADDVVPDPRSRDRQSGHAGLRRRHHPARGVCSARGDARRHEHRQHTAGHRPRPVGVGAARHHRRGTSTARSGTDRCGSGVRTDACSASPSRPASSAPAITTSDVHLVPGTGCTFRRRCRPGGPAGRRSRGGEGATRTAGGRTRCRSPWRDSMSSMLHQRNSCSRSARSCSQLSAGAGSNRSVASTR